MHDIQPNTTAPGPIGRTEESLNKDMSKTVYRKDGSEDVEIEGPI